jgi:hypothetical protein
MSLLSVLVAVVVVGILLWAINNFIPMDGKVKSILNAIVVIVLIVWLLRVFGILDFLGDVRVN